MATTGHESEAVNVQGLKASLQKLKTDYIDGSAYLEGDDSSAVIADFDPQADTVWKKQQTLSSAEKTQVQQNIGVYGRSQTYTKTEVNGLVSTPHQNYVTVSATSQTSAATDVLPASGQSADTIYRVSNWDGNAGSYDVTKYSEYAWDDVSNPNKYVFLRVETQIGEVFDISVYNNNAEYDDLEDALGTDGANVPESVRRGGMSVKFVQSSDHKYVQYRLMSDTFNTTVANWQGVDNEPTAGSDNLVKSDGVKDAIEDVKDFLPRKQTRVENPTIISGKVVKWDGTIVDNDSFGYTAPILLKAGATIVLNMGGKYYVSNSAKNAGIYKTDSSGNYVSLIYGTVSNAPLSYKNESNEDIYIGLCSYPTLLPYYIEEADYAASKEIQDKMYLNMYGIKHTINVTAGTTHGAGADILNQKFVSGTKLFLSLQNGTGKYSGDNVAAIRCYKNAELSQYDQYYITDETLELTLSYDIYAIGTYIAGTGITQSGTLLLCVDYNISILPSKVETLEDKAGTLPQWKDKIIGLYGDSITQLCGNEIVTPHSWADYMQKAIGCDFVPRGWGATLMCHYYVPNVVQGQTPEGVSVWWEFDSQGNRKSVGQGDVVTSYTGMCDWQRIITQFPATIKDTIDAVILMGGTNDLGSKPLGDLTFTEGVPTDPETQDVPWGQSAYFNGGDYNINTYKGAVASAIMKLQAWMPQAVIIIATPLSAPNKTSGATNANTNTPYSVPSGEMQGLIMENYADAAMEASRYLSIPVIDIFGNTGINHFNRSHHLIDGVHPSAQNGNGITDAGGVMHYDGCKNMARVFLGGLNGIHPKIDYVEWTES